MCLIAHLVEAAFGVKIISLTPSLFLISSSLPLSIPQASQLTKSWRPTYGFIPFANEMWNLTGSGIVNLLFLRFEVTMIPVLVVLFPSFSCALDRKEINDLRRQQQEAVIKGNGTNETLNQLYVNTLRKCEV